MENCTIYSHHLKFDQVIKIVKKYLPKAKLEVEDEGIEKSLVATVKGGFFSKAKILKINYRERENPSYKLDKVECDLTQNLSGMVNYIKSLPAKNPTVRNKFLYKVMAANCEMPFMAEPGFTEEFNPILTEILQELDAFIFAQPNSFLNKSDSQYFADKELNLIVDAQGNCLVNDIEVSVDVKYHDQPASDYLQDQMKRKKKSEELLSRYEVKINKNLPCVESESEVRLRSKREVIERAYALMVVSVVGEGIDKSRLREIVEEKEIVAVFTPNEVETLNAEELSERDRIYASWRYESLYTLLWALGKTGKLVYPSEMCNADAVVNAIYKPSRCEFENTVQLRSKAEILDELDKTYRMHWACVDARIKGEEVSGGLNASVVYERHYALNWLTNYMDQEWDDVSTDT
ncbi:DUF4272 domain-containing protein [Chondrinema litorale]|uniref:DUF4272 domain-containing protein n=1 Tax=Chondrinema litorale TaxID=2994555 RepID=UPI0025436448|nr:DUF4272 domain-containing protein [Chondrinema litorale]UZR98300.1 DUF4272 domain-containing protein [Chondrinema litorale]